MMNVMGLILLSLTVFSAEGSDQSHYEAAVKAFAQKKFPEALLELKQVNSDPSVLRAVPLLRSEIYLSTGKFAEAEKDLLSLPENTNELKMIRAKGLARAKEGRQDYRAAAEQWTKALELEWMPTNDLLAHHAQDRVLANDKIGGLNFCDSSKYLARQSSYRALCKAHVYHSAKENSLAIEMVQRAKKLDKYNREALNAEKEWFQNK